MKNILLILTGGTIGSRIKSDGTISPDGDPQLVSVCAKRVESFAVFDVTEPFCVLSENMTVKHRELLIKEILSADPDKYDGVIVTHGSDTLTYTAALCGMAARSVKIPVVFVASDLVLSDPCANGPDNFVSAVSLICDSKVKRGIYICYRDDTRTNSVYLATRLCQADPFLDRFSGFDGTRFGYIRNTRFFTENSPLSPSLDDVNAEKDDILPKDFTLTDCVALLHSSPGFDYSRFDITGLRAVINYGYHSATVDSDSFFEFASRCRDKGVDVWLASFKDKDAPVYESLAKILKLGNVRRMYNISPEAAYSKLLLAYSTDKALLDKELYYETVK